MNYHINILQIGCGGTGGYLTPKIARLLYCLKEYRKHMQIEYVLMDHDIVEEANLYRQNFIPADTGKNKAEVLAKRYGGHFQVPIKYVAQKLETAEQINKIFNSLHFKAVDILIGCVDNNRARQVMHQHFKQASDIIYIDAGNGKYTGQVVVGYKKNGEEIQKPVGDLFPQIFKEEEPQPANCTLNALENPQNIGANDLAATLIFSIINIILTDGKLTTHTIFFDGMEQTFTTKKI